LNKPTIIRFQWLQKQAPEKLYKRFEGDGHNIVGQQIIPPFKNCVDRSQIEISTLP
jgi:hypothetical protein